MSSSKLTKEEFDFRVGNGARVVVVAIWTYVFETP